MFLKITFTHCNVNEFIILRRPAVKILLEVPFPQTLDRGVFGFLEEVNQIPLGIDQKLIVGSVNVKFGQLVIFFFALYRS